MNIEANPNDPLLKVFEMIRKRYGGEVVGKTAAVDEAIGQGLGQSEETVRQARLLIQQRLAA